MEQLSPTNQNLASTRVAIVGAGPFGLELAVELARHQIPFEIFDAGSLGHTISWWAPQTRWFSSNERISIAGVPLVTPDQSKATREQYLAYLRSVAGQFRVRLRTHEPVVDIQRLKSGFEITSAPTSGRVKTRCQVVVFAIGGLNQPRRLQIEGDSLPHVDRVLREPHQYFGRRVLVIGGRNSAIEAALRLFHAGAQVGISYRRPQLPRENIKYWLLPEIEGLIRSGRVQAWLGTYPQKITPEAVWLAQTEADVDHHPMRVPVDHVLALIGYEQDKTLFRKAGVELRGDNLVPVFETKTLETNVPGIYVGGTAVAGTQSSGYQVFLENCHEHVDRIVSHLTGRRVVSERRTPPSQIAAAPES